jgi:hypothetical protein
MSFLRRLRASSNTEPGRVGERRPQAPVPTHLLGGDEDLEIVGESNYQDALWRICGGRPGSRVQYQVVALLVPEPDNPHDPNAICVHIDGHRVGYLSRGTAVEYGPGLYRLMQASGGYVQLYGVIVGGGYYDDRPGMLGVWLQHDPADFGLAARQAPPPARPTSGGGTMRTGFSDAWASDIADDSYDLSWYDDLPEADRPAIAMLRGLLATDPDPIDRHFQFAELEARLYRSRDLYETALDEYDAACQAHDAEMDIICKAFMEKWGKVPLLGTYRQMAIRQQKKKDWRACLWWAERGLTLYGNDAAREEAVEDLLKRRNRALTKIEALKSQDRC